MTEAQGFPAFEAQRRSTRGRSWWARAWVQALEDTSLDNDQLRKGRRYANSGQVGTITISPGRIAATVYSPEDTYEAVVRVDELSEDEWSRFLDQVAARAGHIAALLDGEMPHDLVEAASDAGVPLLPGIGDLDPTCTCDGWELPCQHAAGLCYQVAWLLDSDPFVLLLLRGRSRDDLLDQLQSRQAREGSAAAEPGEPIGPDASAGVSAADVLTTSVADLPDVPQLPGKVTLDELAVSGIEPPEGFAPAALPLLVLDASRRARALLNALLHGVPEPQPLDEWQDAVRLAADFPELSESLADTRDLALGIQAWRYGGAPGLDVLERTWTPAPAELARARTELVAAEFAVEIRDNRITVGADTQLRLDHRGHWHPYRLIGDTWTPAAPATTDPLGALATDW
ncbi:MULTISPECIES: SWIM zinc finger family protein [unclassified Kribbella]|uniref:SWIM zinc finger family protein n=1 Tax=unclassified Kribbella TaxID=2644121 RepID=UPI003017FE01